MIAIEEAISRVLEAARPLPCESVPLGESLGRVLAEDVMSDIDSPPHDKALMDGYAVVATDIRSGVELTVIEQITAGQTPRRKVHSGEAARIMTGAPIPSGADAVVMVERTQSDDEPTRVRIIQEGSTAGDHILRRGAAMRAGDRIVARHRELRPMEVGLLAEAGHATVRVHGRPRVSVLATGDELVEVAARPAPGQIRNSNGPMLEALARRAGGIVRDLGIVADQREALSGAILAGLDADIMLLAGGVSAGVLDLAPSVLIDVGVRPVFHHVRLKPGKPLWFGVWRKADHRCLVFGLPGNPVSGLVCFELIVRPAIEQLSGRSTEYSSRRRAARLGGDFAHRGDRPTCYPASLVDSGQGPIATPLEWKGSADLRCLTEAQGLILFPAGDRAYVVGDPVDVYLL